MRRIHASVLLLLVGCNFGTMTPADTALDEDGSSEESGDASEDSGPAPAETTGSVPGSSSDGEESGAETGSDGGESSGDDESSASESTGGDPDWAMTFDGNDEASTVGSVAEASLGTEFTVETWFFASPMLRGVMVDTRDGAPGSVGWVLYVEKDAPRRLVFGFNADFGGASVFGPDVGDLLGGWHHVAATRDAAGTLTLWIDGEDVEVVSGTPAPVDANVPVRVGRFFDTAYDYWLRGSLDDIHISDVARYSEPFTPAPAEVDENSALLWTFEEGSGSAFDLVHGIELVVDGAVWEEREA